MSAEPRPSDAEPAPEGRRNAEAGGALVAGRPHAQFPGLAPGPGRLAAGHHLPGGQAGDGPRRGGPPQHALPHLPGADGPGPAWRAPGHRHDGPGLGIRGRPGGHGQARAARAPRRLLPAAGLPRHGQHPDPRDGLGGRRGALGRQHPVLVPVHDRPLGQLHPPVAAAVRHGAGADGPLPPQRPGDGRRPPAVRDGPGPDRRAGRLAGEQGAAAGSSWTSTAASCWRRGCRCRIRRDGTPGGCGSASRAPARSGSSTRAPGGTRPSPRRRGSPAGSTSPATWRSSGSRRSARRPSSAASRSPSGSRPRSAPAASAWSTWPAASRSRCCGSRRACRRSSPCRCSPTAGIPELINDDAKLLENSFVVPDAALADVPAALRGPRPHRSFVKSRAWTAVCPSIIRASSPISVRTARFDERRTSPRDTNSPAWAGAGMAHSGSTVSVIRPGRARVPWASRFGDPVRMVLP